MKTLVIPDIHLKIELIDYAKSIIEKEQVDEVVLLGDYFDEWKETKNDFLYKTTVRELRKLYEYSKENKIKITFLLGNHDIPYITGKLRYYSNCSKEIQLDILNLFKVIEPKIAYRTQGWTLSHAGILEHKDFYFKEYSELTLDNFKELDYSSTSPVWLRPHLIGANNMSKQIVGHTPVSQIINLPEDLYLVDTWSKDSALNNIGNKDIIVIDNNNIKKIKYKVE